MNVEVIHISTKAHLVRELELLGYRIDEKMSFNYRNTLNKGHYNARACRVVEADTGIGFANVNARRDKNFRKLQDLRQWADVVINGRVYEI